MSPKTGDFHMDEENCHEVFMYLTSLKEVIAVSVSVGLRVRLPSCFY